MLLLTFLVISDNENCLRCASARKCPAFAVTIETPLKDWGDLKIR